MSGEALPPAIRASDAERDATVIRLRDAMAEGRLTLEDFSLRTDTALTALTRDQLAEVIADLPAHAPVTAVPAGNHPTPWVVGILGGARRSGRWQVGHKLHVIAVMGGCKVDLRGAVIDLPLITIEAISMMGSVEVIVPEGVEVVLEGVAIMGSKHLRMSNTPIREGAPIVRVTGLALMGGITVRNTPTLMERARKVLGELAEGRRDSSLPPPSSTG